MQMAGYGFATQPMGHYPQQQGQQQQQQQQGQQQAHSPPRHYLHPQGQQQQGQQQAHSPLLDTMVPDFWREGKDFFFGRHINMGDLVVVKRADGTMRFAQVSGGAGVGEWQLLVAFHPQAQYLKVQELQIGMPASSSMDLVLQHQHAFDAWNQMEDEEEHCILEQAKNIHRLQDTLRHDHPASKPSAEDVDMQSWPDMFPMTPAYKGPHLQWPLTLDNARQVLHHIRTLPNEPLHPKYLAQLLQKGIQLFGAMPNVARMEVPPGANGKVVLLGDTHGQLQDVLWVLNEQGEPSPSTAYVINGDVADRGPNAVEIFVIILLFKILYPQNVVLNRGNHELLSISSMYGFQDEVKRKHEARLFMMFQTFFQSLPLATVLSRRWFVVHAGLPRDPQVTIQDLCRIDRRFEDLPEVPETGEDFMLWDFMWGDPAEQPGIARNPRGEDCIIRFGPDVTRSFLSSTGLEGVIRSHEVPRVERGGGGYEYRHNGQLITLFTASNYRGISRNQGAVAILDQSQQLRFTEHLSPDLSTIASFYAAQGPAATNSAHLPRHQSTAADFTRSNSAMQHEVLAKVEARVLHHKDELQLFWSKLDDGHGRVTLDQWRQGMQHVLALHELQWQWVEQDLVHVHSGKVDYAEFLRSQTPTVRPDALRDVQSEEVNAILAVLDQNKFTVKFAFSYFDPRDSGYVSKPHFKSALASASAAIATKSQAKSLSEQQIQTLVDHVETEPNGTVDWRKFLEAFSWELGAGFHGPAFDCACSIL